MTATGIRPAVHFPPPFLFAAGLAIAWLLETRLARIHLGGASTRGFFLGFGTAMLIGGLLFTFWGLATFARARTGILPGRPATQIVSHGPYRKSRNPMYTGMATAFFGGALIMNSGWMLILLPIVMLTLYRFVIQPEEKYLTAAFPSEYGEYRQRVRRWI
jgi:protein-S-isoprenylcysteine O-methyltransferase Ste14